MTGDELSRNYEGVFGNRLGLGAKPALLSVDFMNAYVAKGSPFYAEQVVDGLAR